MSQPQYPVEDQRHFRVRTASGSEYDFDNGAGTWSRANGKPGHEHILFMEGVRGGPLDAPVEPIVGNSLTFFTGDDVVRTTPVVSVELL